MIFGSSGVAQSFVIKLNRKRKANYFKPVLSVLIERDTNQGSDKNPMSEKIALINDGKILLNIADIIECLTHSSQILQIPMILSLPSSNS